VSKSKLLLTLLVLSLLALLVGCRNSATGEGFAIYFPKQDIPVSQMAALSYVEIADKPFISQGDIVSYNKETHEIELTAAAAQRVSELQVPLNGKAFVVCVNRQPIYWGAFWTPLSAASFDGVVIMKPLSLEKPVIRLELGYPSESYFKGSDPRSNPKIIDALSRAGKLK